MVKLKKIINSRYLTSFKCFFKKLVLMVELLYYELEGVQGVLLLHGALLLIIYVCVHVFMCVHTYGALLHGALL